MKLDYINGLFEFSGSLVIWLNVYRIYKDKMMRGVDKRVTGFFWIWGIFNLIYYPSLNQWWSFYGGCGIVLANTAWMILAIKYRKN